MKKKPSSTAQIAFVLANLALARTYSHHHWEYWFFGTLGAIAIIIYWINRILEWVIGE